MSKVLEKKRPELFEDSVLTEKDRKDIEKEKKKAEKNSEKESRNDSVKMERII